MAESATATFEARFRRAFDLAMITTMTAWQLFAAGGALLLHLGTFTVPAVAVAAWAVQLMVITIGAIRLLRGRTDAARTWLLVLVNLAAGVAVLAVCPHGEVLRIDWAWATVGLIGVLLLLHRSMWELALLVAVKAAIVLAVLLATVGPDRHTLAGFLTLTYASASIQLAMMTGAVLVRWMARTATDAVVEQRQIALRQDLIAEVAAARGSRYRDAHELVGPVLRGLAAGEVDPGDPEVRHACGVAEAMIRQLMTDHEQDVPHPVLRALRPGIDTAARGGARIDLAVAGTLPPMPDDVGRAIARVPLGVLAATREYARVTVVATEPSGVSVSVLSDGPAPPLPPAREVRVATDRDAGRFWVEVQWDHP
jgi:hypothetical protein